ncbi:hypothetical protein KP509_06G015800 [Ceratopteris richardii]|nr:hypothetical protein KP509_06G015800 [Ceratopteris richardii]
MISKANIVGGTDMEHSESMMDNSSNTFCPIRNAFMDSYSKMDKELQVDPELNCEFSGTTAITLLVQDKLLVIANVGDSRAILAYREGEDGPLRVKQLTVDFKPDLPGELDRIRNCKGRVFALEDEPDVARVWLPHDDKPGLAMARAFGDFCLKEYGLSAVPHVSCRKVKETDEFVVLATDGVWDVMSNEEVANVVAKIEPKDMAAKNVVDAAVRKWKRNFSHVRMDDIAVVCHFLNQKQGAPLISSDNSQSYSSKTSKELESLNSACHQNSVKMEIVVSSIDKEI